MRSTGTGRALCPGRVACGALLAVQASGIAIPRQLALPGFGDLPLAGQLSPGLSSIRPPRGGIGLAAAQAILENHNGGQPQPIQTLPWELVVRGSTAPD